MDYLKSIANDVKAQMHKDVLYAQNRAHFTVTFLELLKPICAMWGNKIMDKRFKDHLALEIAKMLDGISGAMHRTELELWYISGDTDTPLSMREVLPPDYVVSINFRFKGDKWTASGRRRNDSLYGDLKFTLRFPGKRYSNEAFDASVKRELDGANTTADLMTDLVNHPHKLDNRVDEYNKALAALKDVCSDKYADCFPLSSYFQSHQF